MTDAAPLRPRPARMLAITAAWGACFVAIRSGLRDAPTLWFAALRALLAGAVLLGVAKFQHRPRPVGVRAWAQVTVLGGCNVTIAFAAMFAGTAGMAAGIAAVLANAQPLLILLPAWWLFGERPNRLAAAGAAVGFVGLAITAAPTGAPTSGAALSLLAAAAITAGTLLARRLRHLDTVTVSAWHFIIGGAGLLVLATVREGAPTIAWTPRFVLSLAFLALVGTAGAFVLWFEEIQRAPLGTVAVWTFLVPVFGLAFSAVLLGEVPRGWSFASIALVLVGLAGGLAGQPKSDNTRRGVMASAGRNDDVV
ncbi:MAG TPA: DMT family transporter [Acidimicrobiales bacterium]|nr:DMT family transporter [Acidimicrobiales bacterium]